MSVAFDHLLTPCLLIDLDQVERNVARTLAIIGDAARWRPHIKTSKTPAVLNLLLDSPVSRFKCATTKEAAVLLALADGRKPVDLLVALPMRGANLERVGAIARAHPQHRVSVLTEDAAHARLARERFPELGLFVDLDPGYHRTGIPLEQAARAAATVESAGDSLRGLHFYEGHVRDEAPAAREARCCPLYETFLARVDALGLGEAEVITSGTPTFAVAAGYEPFKRRRHAVSPGTVVYWDLMSQSLGIAGYGFAATVLSRVVSHPGGGRVTLDAGSKAVDAAAGEPCCALEGYPELRALTPSEEHLPVDCSAAAKTPAVGELVRLIPRHVCPTVNLADEAVLLRDGTAVGVEAVAGRGHETQRNPVRLG